MPISLHPDNWVKGGGAPPDGVYTIADLHVSVRTGGLYGDSTNLSVIYEDETGQRWPEQFYGAGKAVVPDANGTGFESAPGSSGGLHSSSGTLKLLSSLIEAGLPVEWLEAGDLSCLVGLQGRFATKPFPGGRGSTEPRTVFVATEILALPGEQPAAEAPGLPLRPRPTLAIAGPRGPRAPLKPWTKHTY